MSDQIEDQIVESVDLSELEAEYEEITSDEVDRIVESLDQLIESVASENIRFYLEDAAASIYHLVYDDDVEDSDIVDQAA